MKKYTIIYRDSNKPHQVVKFEFNEQQMFKHCCLLAKCYNCKVTCIEDNKGVWKEIGDFFPNNKFVNTKGEEFEVQNKGDLVLLYNSKSSSWINIP